MVNLGSARIIPQFRKKVEQRSRNYCRAAQSRADRAQSRADQAQSRLDPPVVEVDLKTAKRDPYQDPPNEPRLLRYLCP